MRHWKNEMTMGAVVMGLALGLGLCGCVEERGGGPGWDLGLLDDGKEDTGYLSDSAVEFEVKFASQVRTDQSGLPVEVRADLFKQVQESGVHGRYLVEEQIRYAKNPLNSQDIHLNLSTTDVTIKNARMSEAGVMEFDYEATLESIVPMETFEKMRAAGIELDGRQISALVPDDSEKAFDLGKDCTREEASELTEVNYFYYFDADRPACKEALTRLGITLLPATLTILKKLPVKNVFPEYDQLVSDKRLTAVVYFGIADKAAGPSDWGYRNTARFTSALKRAGFQEGLPIDISTALGAGVGEVEVRTYVKKVGELEEEVAVVGPEVLDGRDLDKIFPALLKDRDVVMYNGHSSYGSLQILSHQDAFPGRYQVFFMNSCWSYEYYAKDIFQANITPDDPRGWDKSDVINNTQVAFFHNMADESLLVLESLFRGAETGGGQGPNAITWDRIINQMNTFAKKSQVRNRTETPEIYGASGVWTNKYRRS